MSEQSKVIAMSKQIETLIDRASKLEESFYAARETFSVRLAKAEELLGKQEQRIAVLAYDIDCQEQRLNKAPSIVHTCKREDRIGDLADDIKDIEASQDDYERRLEHLEQATARIVGVVNVPFVPPVKGESAKPREDTEPKLPDPSEEVTIKNLKWLIPQKQAVIDALSRKVENLDSDLLVWKQRAEDREEEIKRWREQNELLRAESDEFMSERDEARATLGEICTLAERAIERWYHEPGHEGK